MLFLVLLWHNISALLLKLLTMKKIMFSMLLCGAMFAASAQDTNNNNNNSSTTTTTTTTTTHKYYYYPSSNVYFDESTGNYWYRDNSTSQWSMTQQLPSTVTVTNTERRPVTYTGEDPWKNNNMDMKKYKTKKNGTVKMKPKD